MAGETSIKQRQMATPPRIGEYPLSDTPRPDNTPTSARKPNNEQNTWH